MLTAQDLPRLAELAGGGSGTLHPVQQALVDCHASQCGFCTPGFVMSLFALYMNTVAQGLRVSREAVEEALSGNLCRCTGYQPIIEAGLRMADYPVVSVEANWIAKRLAEPDPAAAALSAARVGHTMAAPATYHRPTDLQSLLSLRVSQPQALLAAGATDAGLWVTKLLQSHEAVIDLLGVPELRGISAEQGHISIGAAEPLAEVFHFLAESWPEAHHFFGRFAGRPVRESATLGGNVANGSPIGDSMPF
ncbi:MAG TPA: FAD binding domain-containing protein, partial [Burkholderiaceae bacterium]|nr:FAD binding domain-containing protein [Burkholderiaceae bacterium]